MLVLSLFPGIGLLDHAFELEGFCVVRGPDLLWGGDIREFHPPAGRFDGVIGGPPCQAFSTSNTSGKGENLIPEFCRVVREACPRWWVMENVPGAPLPEFACLHQIVNNRAFGGAQRRVRRISSNLSLSFPGEALEAIDYLPCASTSLWIDGRQYGAKSTRFLPQFIEAQGLPKDFDLPGFTVQEKVRAICNGVPIPMGRAIARAVRKALG